jgi:hypothetical protein
MKRKLVDLTFENLRLVSAKRSARWHGGGIEDWNIAEWTNAMAGEAGEACNASKKLRRLECQMQQHDGDTPVPLTLQNAKLKVAKECADAVIYADLVCQRLGIRLEDAIIEAFNSISTREGFPERL